ncbi:hypothetical protein H6P81_016728 [Aristolochia fimbriata]|uniref:Fatty acid hydroxylase domain-containing protein n=1 Tax=Aristolochia fimbriata TaxID=158543 RepID=A0AAV7E999_ARIFI|nr:hypothetical protein H6P81_016728 [Aristolochia fimbriata]
MLSWTWSVSPSLFAAGPALPLSLFVGEFLFEAIQFAPERQSPRWVLGIVQPAADSSVFVSLSLSLSLALACGGGGGGCGAGGARMLPYETMQEAEAALGRELTFAERLWFWYSAQASDFWLYCHNIAFLLLVFTLAPLPIVFLERKRARALKNYKLQPKVHVPSQTMIRCYKEVMQTFICVVGPLQLISFPTVKFVGIRTSLPLPSGWEIFFQLLVYFLIEDYGNYWIHRLLHCKWGYEKIHRVHHEFTAPIGFAAPYAHWAEVLILGIPSFAGPALVPGHMVTFWLWMILRQMEAIETHSGYDFPLSPTKYIPFYGGAEYHDYHHYVGGQSQSNFASVFTYCDFLYGTDKGYRYQKEHLAKLREQWRKGEENGLHEDSDEKTK